MEGRREKGRGVRHGERRKRDSWIKEFE